MCIGIKYTLKTYVRTILKYFRPKSIESRPGRAGSRRISRLKGENKHLLLFFWVHTSQKKKKTVFFEVYIPFCLV